MEIKNIEKEIEEIAKNGSQEARRLAQIRMEIAAESSRLVDREMHIHSIYAQWFNENREEFKSDKAAYNKWRATKLGQEEAEILSRQKQLKALKEGIGSMLRVLDNEARNIH